MRGGEGAAGCSRRATAYSSKRSSRNGASGRSPSAEPPRRRAGSPSCRARGEATERPKHCHHSHHRRHCLSAGAAGRMRAPPRATRRGVLRRGRTLAGSPYEPYLVRSRHRGRKRRTRRRRVVQPADDVAAGSLIAARFGAAPDGASSRGGGGGVVADLGTYEGMPDQWSSGGSARFCGHLAPNSTLASWCPPIGCWCALRAR